MKSKFQLVWFTGLGDKQKESLDNLLNNNSMLLGRLVEILKERREMLLSKEVSEKHFSDPEWAIRQAYYSGQRKSIEETLALFSIKGD